jgi:hypothetical protein
MLISENLGGALKWNSGAAPSLFFTGVLIGPKPGVRAAPTVQLWIGHLCFRCLLPSEHLNKCSGCKRAVYCTKACQIQDWEIKHKKDCKFLKRINEIEV